MSVFARALGSAVLLFAMTGEAWAYGGPGAAITLIGSLIGVGLAIFASLFYVVVWPFRRLWKKRKTTAAQNAQNEAPADPAGAAAATVEAADSAKVTGAASRVEGH